MHGVEHEYVRILRGTCDLGENPHPEKNNRCHSTWGREGEQIDPRLEASTWGARLPIADIRDGANLNLLSLMAYQTPYNLASFVLLLYMQ